MIATLSKFAIAALAAVALAPVCSAQAQLAGDWSGSLELNGESYHVAWHAVAAKDGTLTSTFDNPDENIFGIKVKSTTLKGNDLTMIVDDNPTANGEEITIRGEFDGVVSADGNEVNGTWTQTEPEQGPVQVHFKRAAAEPAAAAPAPKAANPEPSGRPPAPLFTASLPARAE